MRLVFEVSGDVQIERELLRVGEHADDVAPAFSRIVDLWIDETVAQFATEGGHASGGWEQLSEPYGTWKALHFPGRGILERSLDLERSLTERGDPNMLLEIGAQELAWGSKLPYAGAHQNPRPTSRLPRRRPVEFTEGARRETVKILQRWILTGQVAA